MARQHTEGKHVEEAAVYEGKVGTYPLVVIRHDGHIVGKGRIACGGLYLRAVAFQSRSHSPRRLRVMQVFAVADDVFIDHVDALTGRKEIIPRLLEAHLANQHDARRQSDGQAGYLRPVMLAPLV